MDNSPKAPIGVFDSGFGGLTVLKELVSIAPGEDYIFLGDRARCPYGPREQSEVAGFVLQICEYLQSRGCKLIVIACNTATAAGLALAQQNFNIPVVGVVAPGSRAAVHMTRNRRVGVLATKGTIDSGAYEGAIHALDAGIEVFSAAAPKFVEMAEAGLQFGGNATAAQDAEEASCIQAESESAPVYDEDTCEAIAEGYIAPLREAHVDTIVMGCTHYPLIQSLIERHSGAGVTLVSSPEETAREVYDILSRRGELSMPKPLPGSTSVQSKENWGSREYLTTGYDVEEFKSIGELVMAESIDRVFHLDL